MAKAAQGEELSPSVRALLRLQAAAALSQHRNIPCKGHTQGHPKLGDLEEPGLCLDVQAVDSQKYKQLEAEEATVRNSLNVFLENAAVSEQ